MDKTMQTEDTTLVLRTCDRDLKSRAGFEYPRSGYVAAPDWDPEPECGHGLHGLAHGEGNGALLNWALDALWMVLEVPTKDLVDLGGKVKFPAGVVVFTGDRKGATDYLLQRDPRRVCVGAVVAVGDNSTAVVGYKGTATAGKGGTATAGDGGTATAGDDGRATAGYDGRATAGKGGTATAGYYGILNITWYTGGRRRQAVAYVG